MAYRNYAPENGFIVDKAGNGDFTTIGAALTAATSGKTIYINPGTYSESPTLKAGVNIMANLADGDTPNVTVSGIFSASFSGTCSITGIRLQTNSANLLSISGSNTTDIWFEGCYLNCTNNTGIASTSTGGGQAIFTKCYFDTTTTGIAYFAIASGNQALTFNYCYCFNSGESLTANTAGGSSDITLFGTQFPHYITTSSTATVIASMCNFLVGGNNTTIITTGGSASANVINHCRFESGTASAISVGSGTTLQLDACSINSSNTNAITGAGTLNYQGLMFYGSSKTINVTTQTGGVLPGGVFQAPSAGFIGEQIRSAVASGSAITLTNATPANVTSISLTAGIWDVSGLIEFNGTVTGVTYHISISTTSATEGTDGDNQLQMPTSPNASSNSGISIPAYRLTLTATTTVYLVANAGFTVGTLKAFGRISATRVS